MDCRFAVARLDALDAVCDECQAIHSHFVVITIPARNDRRTHYYRWARQYLLCRVADDRDVLRRQTSRDGHFDRDYTLE